MFALGAKCYWRALVGFIHIEAEFIRIEWAEPGYIFHSPVQHITTTW